MLNKLLVKQQKDVLMDRIEKVSVVTKYEMMFGAAILCSFVTILLGLLSMWSFAAAPPPPTTVVNLEKKEMQNVITLPYPHQSYRIVSGWIKEAATDLYSFDFNDFDSVVKNMEYYFTEEGYRAYYDTMMNSGIRQKVIDGKIKVSTVVTGSPVMISGGIFGNIEYWRFATPVRVSFYGGENSKPQDVLVDMLVVRIPTHKNSKGLGIAEFNMKAL